MGEILKIDSIEKYYGNKGNILKAIDDVLRVRVIK